MALRRHGAGAAHLKPSADLAPTVLGKICVGGWQRRGELEPANQRRVIEQPGPARGLDTRVRGKKKTTTTLGAVGLGRGRSTVASHTLLPLPYVTQTSMRPPPLPRGATVIAVAWGPAGSGRVSPLLASAGLLPGPT